MKYLVIIALFLGGLQLGAQTKAPTRAYAGVVNGDTIWLEEYSKEVGRRTEYVKQRGNVDPSEIMQQAWNELTQRRLLLRESVRLGLRVTNDDIDSMFLKATPDFIKRGVVDDKGKFDLELLKAILYKPDSLVKANTQGMSEKERAEEMAQLRASVAQWREIIGLSETEKRIRIAVTDTVRLDTATLLPRFREAATSATADVIYMPCKTDLPAPSITEMESYHKANPTQFASPKPMRRLAYLAWPMVAAPVDSALVLGNVSRFVSLLNGARNARKRDSLWQSVAATTSSGTARLSPDSAAQASFYGFVKGKKAGTAVGPIGHASGVHVLLVDSVINVKGKRQPDIRIRVIVSEIEPSRQTVDSILKIVDDASGLYDQGMELGAIAGRFGRTIELSPWFTDDDKVFGSYRLGDIAFKTQVAMACDPIDTPEKGVVLGVVVDSMAAGPMPFDAAAKQVANLLIRQRGCEQRRDAMKTVMGLTTRLDDGLMFIAENPKGAQIMRGVSVQSGFIGEEMYDPTAAAEILAKPLPNLYGPFLGDLGWYIVNITGIVKANEAEFPMWLELRTEDLLQERKQAVWDEYLNTLRAGATIDDNRWFYFRY
ncbi:MAG: Parvulin-like peptidyl-prolyl isomerase [Bacteroidota bacterium]